MQHIATSTERLIADAFRDTRVLLVGFPNKYQNDLLQSLRVIGVHANASAADRRQLQDLAHIGLSFTHVLLNIDVFDDEEACIEALMTVRSSAPNLVIVAFSEMVSEDDFSRERRWICDGTLKLPVSAPRLINGLVMSFLNNADAF